MSVRKRKWTTRNGEAKEAWIVDYFDQEGDRHIQTFERKKDADAYARRSRSTCAQASTPRQQEHHRRAGGGRAGSPTSRLEGSERATVQGYRQHVDLHIIPRHRPGASSPS